MLIRKKNRNIIKNIINRKKNKIEQYKLIKILKNCFIINMTNKITSNVKYITQKKKKICLNTGRYSSVNRNFNFTRQQLNKYLTINKIDNYNIASW